MNKIRILEVIGSLKIGGAEKVVLSIIEYLDHDKYQVDYLVYDDIDNEYCQIVRDNGGNIMRIKINPSNPFVTEKKLKNFFKNNRYDIVHAHMMFHNGIVLSAAKKAKIPHLISHAHSTSDGKNSKSIANLVYKCIARLKLRSKKIKYVACGEKAGLCLYGIAFYKRGIYFNNRIDSSKFIYSPEKHDALKKKLSLSSNESFLIVGHLVPLKNHKLAFEAFKKYHDTHNDSKLYVLGDGELKEKLIEDANNMGLSESIIFKGNVNNVNEYMIASDHILMPSWYEGFPVTLVEAQSSGLHCLVSKNITPEVEITDLVSWCSIDDVEAWVNAMNKKYTRSDRSLVIKEKNFDFSNYSMWLDSFYESVLK